MSLVRGSRLRVNVVRSIPTFSAKDVSQLAGELNVRE
jgi:hypothetical protein